MGSENIMTTCAPKEVVAAVSELTVMVQLVPVPRAAQVCTGLNPVVTVGSMVTEVTDAPLGSRPVLGVTVTVKLRGWPT